MSIAALGIVDIIVAVNHEDKCDVLLPLFLIFAGISLLILIVAIMFVARLRMLWLIDSVKPTESSITIAHVIRAISWVTSLGSGIWGAVELGVSESCAKDSPMVWKLSIASVVPLLAFGLVNMCTSCCDYIGMLARSGTNTGPQGTGAGEASAPL